MKKNDLFYRFLALLTGTVLMSFAWPLRGQFGHAWGASITGAMAASLSVILIPRENWRRAFPQAVLLGVFGFVLGGENVAYGALVESILARPTLPSVLPQLLLVLFIGATWGGIGAAYLGYGLAEIPLSLKNYVILAGGGLVLILLSSLMEKALLLQMSFLLLTVVFLFGYNRLFIRSKIVNIFGSAGMAGFGSGFLIAVILLFYGNKGLLPGQWWSLRDQIGGGLGGLALATALLDLERRGLEPKLISSLPIQRLGCIVFFPLIGGINTFNTYQKWFTFQPPAPEPALAGILIAAGCVLLLGALLFYLTVNAKVFRFPAVNGLILLSFLFLAWYLAFFGIAKSIIYSGWSVWETGFALFLFDSLFLTLVLPLFLRKKKVF